MRKMRNLSYLLVVALALVLSLASCSNKPKYAGMIPENTVAIVRVNLMKVAEHSSESGDILSQKIKDGFKNNSMPVEQREKLMKAIDHPEDMGIDLRDPVLVCIGNNKDLKEVTLLATIHDAAKFEEFLKLARNENREVKTKGEVKYLFDEDVVVGFNDDALCIVPAHNETDGAAKVEKILSGQSTMKDSKFVDKLMDCDGDAQVLVIGEVYAMVPDAALLNKSFPAGLNMKDVALLSDIDMDRGEIDLDYEILTASKEWEDYIDECDKICGKIKGDYAGNVSKDGLVMMANIDGPKMLEQIEKNKEIQALGKEAVDIVKNIYGSISGDVAVSVAGYNEALKMPGVTLYAKTKDDAISGLLTPFMPLLGENAKSGYQDGSTYVTIATANAPLAGVSNAFSKGDVDDKHFYLYFNFSLLRTIAMANGGSSSEGMFVAAALLDEMEIDYKGDGKGEMDLKFREKSKYPIETLINMIDKMK